MTKKKTPKQLFFEEFGLSAVLAKRLIDCEVAAVKESVGYGDSVDSLIRTVELAIEKRKWYGLVPPVQVKKRADGELEFVGHDGVSIRGTLERALTEAKLLQARQISLAKGRQWKYWLRVKLRQDAAVVVADQTAKALGKNPLYYWSMGMILYTGFGGFLEMNGFPENPALLRKEFRSHLGRYKTRLKEAKKEFKNDRTQILTRILSGENREWWGG